MTIGNIVLLSLIPYAAIGLVFAYLIAAYHPKFNDRQDLTLQQFAAFGLAAMLVWPCFPFILIYEIFIEDRNLSKKIVVKYRGK